MNPRATSRTELESISLIPFLAIAFIATLSGLLANLPSQATLIRDFGHWNSLGHTVAGLVTLFPMIIYVTRHFKRTLGVRRPHLLISGLALTLVLTALWCGGIMLVLHGITENTRWIITSHIWLSYIFAALTVAHIAMHSIRSSRAPARSAQVYQTINSNTFRRSAAWTLSYVICICVATLFYHTLYYKSDFHRVNEVSDYEYTYGENPFLPSQTHTPDNDFLSAQVIGNSENCSACHQEIFQQWSSSMHRLAASDPAYVKNVFLLEETQGISATRYCEGCHAPVALLSGQLSPGGEHGGVAGTIANSEGVGCMSCHGISRTTHLKGVASYHIVPNSTYLFEHTDSSIGRKIHNLLIRINPKIHRQAMAKDILGTSEHCSTCHEQFMDKSMNNWGWVKMQNEYSSWLNSSFSGQSEHSFRQELSMRCQDCHFPLVESNDPSANENKKVRSHRSPGANTALPWLNKDSVQLETVERFLQAGKVLISIDKPSRVETLETIQFVDEEIRRQAETPFFAYLGEEVELNVSVTNRMVGHNFPGGTTDLNQAWIEFLVADAEHRTIFESGSINNNGHLGSDAHVYKTIPVDRYGREVWKHNLFEMVGDSYKKLIPPNQADNRRFSFTIPWWAKSPINVYAKLQYRKLNRRYSNWALSDVGNNPVLPITLLSRDSLSFPIKNKPAIEQIE